MCPLPFAGSGKRKHVGLQNHTLPSKPTQITIHNLGPGKIHVPSWCPRQLSRSQLFRPSPNPVSMFTSTVGRSPTTWRADLRCLPKPLMILLANRYHGRFDNAALLARIFLSHILPKTIEKRPGPTGLKLAADWRLDIGHSNVQYIFQMTLDIQNQNYQKRTSDVRGKGSSGPVLGLNAMCQA